MRIELLHAVRLLGSLSYTILAGCPFRLLYGWAVIFDLATGLLCLEHEGRKGPFSTRLSGSLAWWDTSIQVNLAGW